MIIEWRKLARSESNIQMAHLQRVLHTIWKSFPSAVADPWLKGGRPGWWVDEFFTSIFISVDFSFVPGWACPVHQKLRHASGVTMVLRKKYIRPTGHDESRADVQGRPDSHLMAGLAQNASDKNRNQAPGFVSYTKEISYCIVLIGTT